MVVWPIDCTRQNASAAHSAPASTHCAQFMSLLDALAPSKLNWMMLVNTVLPQLFVTNRRK